MAIWGPSTPFDGEPVFAKEGELRQAIPPNIAATFAGMSARRIFIFGGIGLIAAGMLFGDIFAVFVLHQNASQTGEALLSGVKAVAAHDAPAARNVFSGIGGLLEDRGTKIDAHVHMTDAGYLALLLALIQPYVALSKERKRQFARLFVLGGVALPAGIFLIHYVGLAYSPFSVIGWASVLADSAGGLLIVVLLAQIWGLWRHFRSVRSGSVEPEMPLENSWNRRALLTGGTVLVLLGFLHGAWYSAKYLYEHEAREARILNGMLDEAGSHSLPAAAQSVSEYGGLQAEKAVMIAAHSHLIEFGLLAMLLSFIQPYVFLSDLWKARCVKMLLAGSILLPVFVLLELRMGLIAGGIADFGGLLVIIAMSGMLVGVLRYSGRLDAETGGAG